LIILTVSITVDVPQAIHAFQARKNVFNRHSKGGNDAVFLFFIAGQLCVFGLFLGHHQVFRVVLNALKAFVQPQSSVGRNKSKRGFFIKGFFIVITTRLGRA
jgi:hypothetical protein